MDLSTDLDIDMGLLSGIHVWNQRAIERSHFNEHAIVFVHLGSRCSQSFTWCGPRPSLDMGLMEGHLPIDAVDLIEMAGPDYERLLDEDDRNANKGMASRIAVTNAVSITPATNGTWEVVDDGRLMWRLRVLSPEQRTSTLVSADLNCRTPQTSPSTRSTDRTCCDR